MMAAVRDWDLASELAMYALVGGCILVVALVIAGLVILIRLLVRSARNNGPDVR
ncbi:MAG: hypothetical protein WD871_03215 [Xanthobacteraceae bacterium]